MLINTFHHVSILLLVKQPLVADAIPSPMECIDKPFARVVYLFDTMANHQKRNITKHPDGCWTTDRNNLEILVNGKVISFKAFIYMNEKQVTLPEKVRIKNTCNNFKCVNPDHFRIISPEMYSIDADSGCWINPRTSYAIQQNKKTINIIRFLYEKHIGKLESDRRLKKVCNTTNCVNPHHYERIFMEPEYFINENGCWVCTNKTVNHKYGYPSIYINGTGKNIMLSKYNYIKKYGDLPDGMEMRHKCDNKMCINPDHMEPGTHKQNMEDMGVRNKTNKGTKNPFSKLTIEQAKMAKFNKAVNAKKMAIDFNVSHSTILAIRNGKKWKWLQMDSISE
jgi:hypothetical protein